MWENIWLLLTFSFISVQEKYTSFLWKLSCWNTNISFACMLKKVKAFLFEKETCRVVKLYSEKLLHPFQMYLMLEEVAHFFGKWRNCNPVRLVCWLIFSSLRYLFWSFQILQLDLEKVFISEMVNSPSIICFSIFAKKWMAFSKEEL